jgi:hypothetical protein
MMLWHERLSAAVIGLAVREACDPKVSEATRRQAQAFLDGSDGLQHWAELAGVDAAAIASRARKLWEQMEFSE